MTTSTTSRRGFTLMETVIAIGVLAVLLTAFLTVFGPATAGIRRAISAQEADRLASTLEKELGTLRANEKYTTSGAGAATATAFDKAFDWIKEAKKTGTKPSDGTILVYQYRADPTKMRDDGSLAAYTNASSGLAGSDYVIQAAVRRRKEHPQSEERRLPEGRPEGSRRPCLRRLRHPAGLQVRWWSGAG
ncbi:MAG: prepilin-type N-terminal cleavage/methylation domain-containing protein [Luteolibacter sp.]